MRVCAGRNLEIVANQSRMMEKQRWIQRYGRYAVIGLAIALLCMGFNISDSWAQESPGDPPLEEAAETGEPAPPEAAAETGENFSDNPITAPLEQLAPPEVRAFWETPAETQIAPILLDGRVLFHVTAAAGDSTLTAIRRAADIEKRLVYLAQTILDSGNIDGLNVDDTEDDSTNQPIIYINDEALMTVTYLDASLHGATMDVRADQLVSDLEYALTRYYLERQPEFLWQRVRWVAAIILLTLLGSFALTHFYRGFATRRQHLIPQAHPQASSGAKHVSNQGMVPDIRKTLLNQQRANSLRALEQTLQFTQVALWVGSGFVILGLFPYTRWLQPLIVSNVRLPLRLLLLSLVAYGLIRLANIWIDRILVAVQTNATPTIERSQRLALRLSTFSHVIKSIVAAVIGVIAFLIILSQLGVQVAPLLTGAGLVGVAISLASQNLIKDIINGLLILLEDQYGVGDVIIVREVSGFVETMNLRITQLRDTGGQLITIPNSQIDIVQNLSKEWSRVDLMIPVGLEANIDQALQLVEEIATEMSQDGIWGPLILEPPLLLGVDNLDHAGATIRIWIKTQPLKQWDVAREYRRRLKIAFEAAQIPLGVPQQVLHVMGTPPDPVLTGTTSSATNGTPTEVLETPSASAQS
ncbi:MAG: mechanosensitive ion channel family protein [Leptolyngbya sp. SIO1E4]|nr:mechanosensitive ion channel family protein [Leptolyngbya sp. SIO1E4]